MPLLEKQQVNTVMMELKARVTFDAILFRGGNRSDAR
jgi:hypothetical protein